MLPKRSDKPILSSDDKLRLASIYESNGHVYVTNMGYVHIHFYLKAEDDIDFIIRKLHAAKKKHRQVFDLTLTKRARIAKAAILLLELPLSVERKQELSLVHNYATSKNRTERYGIARQLRGKPLKGEDD